MERLIGAERHANKPQPEPQTDRLPTDAFVAIPDGPSSSWLATGAGRDRRVHSGWPSAHASSIWHHMSKAAAGKRMARMAAAAAIGAILIAPTSAVSSAGERPVWLAQSAEADHSHQHQTETAGEHHEGAPEGAVRVEMQANPARLEAGTRAELVFALSDASGGPVGELLPHHGRRLHVFIVSGDMRVLGHIHPQDFGETVKGGLAKAFFTFPQGGRYLVAVDFMTAAQGSQDEQFVVEVQGPSAGPAAEAEVPPGIASVRLEQDDRYTEPALLQAMDNSGTYAVSLQQPDAIKAGEAVNFAFRFVRNGEPLTDLRPYLEAPMHLAVVKGDLTAFLHIHGTIPGNAHAGHGGHGSRETAHGSLDGGPEAFGPAVAATVTFPEPGTYYLFAQAAHGDQLLISRFPVHVE